MPAIDWSKEKLTPEQFFDLPQDERLKIIGRHVPMRVKIPIFLLGLFGILANCLVSAFAGTTVYNYILAAGNTEFSARFWSLALSLFLIQMLMTGMNSTGKWVVDKIFGRNKK